MKNRVECSVCLNQKCLIKHCEPDFIDSIQTQKNYIFYKKGQHIIIEGSLVFGVYFIKEGQVKVVSMPKMVQPMLRAAVLHL